MRESGAEAVNHKPGPRSMKVDRFLQARKHKIRPNCGHEYKSSRPSEHQRNSFTRRSPPWWRLLPCGGMERPRFAHATSSLHTRVDARYLNGFRQRASVWTLAGTSVFVVSSLVTPATQSR